MASCFLSSSCCFFSATSWDSIVPGAWCMVRGAWCVVHGAWCMVHGAWCMVHGGLFTFYVLHLRLDAIKVLREVALFANIVAAVSTTIHITSHSNVAFATFVTASKKEEEFYQNQHMHMLHTPPHTHHNTPHHLFFFSCVCVYVCVVLCVCVLGGGGGW